MGSLTLKPLCFIKFETTPFSQWAAWWWVKLMMVSGVKFQVFCVGILWILWFYCNFKLWVSWPIDFSFVIEISNVSAYLWSVFELNFLNTPGLKCRFTFHCQKPT